MKEGILRRGLVVVIVALFVTTGIVTSTAQMIDISKSDQMVDFSIKDVPNQSKGKILIYATWHYYSLGGYDMSHFWDLAGILQDYGYSVTLTDRSLTPRITKLLLLEYNELWIINSEYDYSGFFYPSEVNTILWYREKGHGLLLNGDNTDPPGGGFAHDVNQISMPLGVLFSGLVDHGGPAIEPDFAQHPLFVGVEKIHGDDNEAILSIHSPAVSVATYQGDEIIAVRDDGKGKVVFDNTITRLMNGENCVLLEDTPQYIKNVADWLASPKLTKTMIVGKFTNYSELDGIITIYAENIRMISLRPFQIFHYFAGEKITFSKNDFKGIIKSGFIIGMIDAVI